MDVARRTKTDMDNSQENTMDNVWKIHDEKFFLKVGVDSQVLHCLEDVRLREYSW